MSSPRSLMALLVVLALSANVAESAIAAPDKCSAADIGKGFCLNCKTKAKCVTIDLPPESRGNCTVVGEACTVLVGVATCKPIANTTCSCAKASQCDVYDPDSLLVCLSGGVTISKSCSSTETCVNGACVTPATTVATVTPAPVCDDDDGFVVVKPACTSAAYCQGGDPLGTTDCASGTYYDVAEQTCMPLPIVPCAGCGTGACPDKSNCSKWYICDGGAVLDEETCDATAPVFDVGVLECLVDGNCTGNANCTYNLATTAQSTNTSSSSTTTSSSFTTTTSSNSTATTTTTATAAISRPTLCTATNVGQRYTYVGNCRKYWSCRLISAGKYAYVESTCLGTLVFNAATTSCDTLANVPGCVPPA